MEVGPRALLAGTRPDPWEAEAGIRLEPSSPSSPHPGIPRGQISSVDFSVLEVNSATVDKGRKPDTIDTWEPDDNALQDTPAICRNASISRHNDLRVTKTELFIC